MNKTELTLKKINTINKRRCKRWHDSGIDNWSISDWAVAMAGEAGEICNAVKKLNRLRDNLPSKNDPGRQIDTVAEAKEKIGEEIADTFLYLDLLAIRLGLNMEKEIIKKFNAVSKKYNFPERL